MARRSILAPLMALLATGCGAPPTPELARRDLRDAYPTAVLVSTEVRQADWQNASVKIHFRAPPDSTTREVVYGYRLLNHAWTLVDRDTTAVAVPPP